MDSEKYGFVFLGNYRLWVCIVDFQNYRFVFMDNHNCGLMELYLWIIMGSDFDYGFVFGVWI